MSGLFHHISRRLSALRGSGNLATQTATDLAPSSEVLVNSLSVEHANMTCTNVESVVIVAEPTGALPCSVEVPTCSAHESNNTVPEVDDCQSSCNRRHRRQRRSRRHRVCRVKCTDINFLSAMCCVIVIVLVCTSLYEPHWWYIGNTHCRDSQQAVVSYLSVKPFFYEGFFVSDSEQQNRAYYFGFSQTDVLKNCVTPHTVYLIKSIVILCFVVIVLNTAAIILDVVLFASRCTKALRNYAVFSILSVCTCVTINILSYVVTQQLVGYYQSNPVATPGADKIDVEFSLCFYVIMASGVVSVTAVASTLLCRRGSSSCGVAGPGTVSRVTRRRRDERLLDGDNSQLYRSFLGDPSLPALPPPYEP